MIYKIEAMEGENINQRRATRKKMSFLVLASFSWSIGRTSSKPRARDRIYGRSDTYDVARIMRFIRLSNVCLCHYPLRMRDTISCRN